MSDCRHGGRDVYEMPDSVNHPQHYSGEIECIDAIESALSGDEFRGFCKGNVIKYVFRERRKGGDKDLQKARWYLERILDHG